MEPAGEGCPHDSSSRRADSSARASSQSIIGRVTRRPTKVPSPADKLGAVHERDSLATAARDGDRAAMDRFVRLLQPDVWRFCAHIASRAHADDLAQEALYRIITHRHRWQRGAVTSWALGVTRNVCLEDIRRHRRRTDPTAEPQLPAVADPTSTTDLLHLLQQLPLDQREALVLTQIIGLSYADAAAVAGCPMAPSAPASPEAAPRSPQNSRPTAVRRKLASCERQRRSCRMCLVHAHRDHEAREPGEGGDGIDGGGDRDEVGDDAGEERADGEAAISP